MFLHFAHIKMQPQKLEIEPLSSNLVGTTIYLTIIYRVGTIVVGITSLSSFV